MSSAAAIPVAAGAGKGKKKLIIIIAALLLVLGLGGGAAVFMMKKMAAHADEEGAAAAEEPVAAHAPAKVAPGTPPTYLPLDPFVVNLADKDAERYAQVTVTLEIDDPKFAEQMKGYMPAIRNAILMILAHKTSTELLERAGKEALAEEIMRESVRPMGIEIDPDDEAADDGAATKKKKRRAQVHNPVRHVYFANFIIQ